MPREPTEVYIHSRRALLDALTALEAHLDALVLVGAQAIYPRQGRAPRDRPATRKGVAV